MKKMWKIWTMTPTTQTEENFGSCELKTRIFAEKCRSKMSVDWHFNALKFPDSMKLIGKINLGNTHFGESISHSCMHLPLLALFRKSTAKSAGRANEIPEVKVIVLIPMASPSCLRKVTCLFKI